MEQQMPSRRRSTEVRKPEWYSVENSAAVATQHVKISPRVPMATFDGNAGIEDDVRGSHVRKMENGHVKSR
jgi:hypothetical protein